MAGKNKFLSTRLVCYKRQRILIILLSHSLGETKFKY